MNLSDVPEYKELSGYKIRGKGLFWQDDHPFPYYFAYIEGDKHYTFDIGKSWARKKPTALTLALSKPNLLT